MDWIRGRQHQIPVCRADNLSFYQCKKSNYQREGFIIQCEGLDEDTGEKEYIKDYRFDNADYSYCIYNVCIEPSRKEFSLE